MIPYATATRMSTYKNDIPVLSLSKTLSQIHSTDEAITAGESSSKREVFIPCFIRLCMNGILVPTHHLFSLNIANILQLFKMVVYSLHLLVSYVAGMSSSLLMTNSPSTEVHSTDEIDVTLYVVSLGVSGAVVVLIVTAAILIICLRMRLCKRIPASFKSEHTYDYISTTDGNTTITTSPNVAYVTSGNIPVSSNPALVHQFH